MIKGLQQKQEKLTKEIAIRDFERWVWKNYRGTYELAELLEAINKFKIETEENEDIRSNKVQ